MEHNHNHDQEIRQLLKENRIFIFMKGEPEQPACRFSAQAVHILDKAGVKYGFFNVLEDDHIRQAIKEFSDWPTLPQIFVDGEFIGGADILAELEENGELKSILG